MTKTQKLILVKVIHTLIWVFFNLAFAYLVYSVWTGQYNLLFWLALGSILLECLVLLLNGWTCPLTYVARRYSNSTRDNFDIYLPNWFARHNKTIYTSLAILLLLGWLWKQFG
jgi:hypothetical protein